MQTAGKAILQDVVNRTGEPTVLFACKAFVSLIPGYLAEHNHQAYFDKGYWKTYPILNSKIDWSKIDPLNAFIRGDHKAIKFLLTKGHMLKFNHVLQTIKRDHVKCLEVYCDSMSDHMEQQLMDNAIHFRAMECIDFLASRYKFHSSTLKLAVTIKYIPMVKILLKRRAILERQVSVGSIVVPLGREMLEFAYEKGYFLGQSTLIAAIDCDDLESFAFVHKKGLMIMDNVFVHALRSDAVKHVEYILGAIDILPSYAMGIALSKSLDMVKTLHSAGFEFPPNVLADCIETCNPEVLDYVCKHVTERPSICVAHVIATRNLSKIDVLKRNNFDFTGFERLARQTGVINYI